MPISDPRSAVIDAIMTKLAATGLVVFDGNATTTPDPTKPWVVLEYPGGDGEMPTLCPGAMWTLRIRTRAVALDPVKAGNFTAPRQAAMWATSKVAGVLLDPTAPIVAGGWRSIARNLDGDSGILREGDSVNHVCDWSMILTAN